MSINPFQLTEEIRNDYISFLESSFNLRNQKIRESFKEELKKFRFINGPILEATPEFKKGRTFEDLIESGLLSPLFREFIYDVLPYLKENNLYLHQDESITKIIDRHQNIIITTGTGSGKTECFLIPIYNYLLREYEQGKLNAGVRALILYPMNALANDQLRRLRQFAKALDKNLPQINITFGRYIGETPQDKRQGLEKFRAEHPDEEPVRGELLSREEMRESPPHILLTNYAMLEYLLLRPEDSPFFDGPFASNWKFLVLDEAHTYRGAKAIEISMLIRRLKERIHKSKKGVLTCIATSATLASEHGDLEEVTEFASKLFDEPFIYDKNNEKSSIVLGYKKEIIGSSQDSTFLIPLKEWEMIESIYNNRKRFNLKDLADKFGKWAPRSIIDKEISQSSNKENFIYNLLLHEKHVKEIRKELSNNPIYLNQIISIFKRIEGVNSDSRSESYIDSSHPDIGSILTFLNCINKIRPDENANSILPARFHLFIRAPEGIYVSFYPEIKVFLQPHLEDPKGFPVFEIATCRRCGQEYIVGVIINNKLQYHFPEISLMGKAKKSLRYFMISGSSTSIEDLTQYDDEDELILDPSTKEKFGNVYYLCSQCGSIWHEDEKRICSCKSDKNSILKLIEIVPKDDALNKCYFCGLRSRSIVKKFYYKGVHPATVITTSLYKEISSYPDKKKKILAFSDSRQEAAFFSSYLENVYNRMLNRRILYYSINNFWQRRKDDDSVVSRYIEYRLEDLKEDTLRFINENQFFEQSVSIREQERIVWGWILQEFIELYPKNSLEDVGLIKFTPIFPKDWIPPSIFRDDWGLSLKEIKALYINILNTLRYNQAITFPENGPRPSDEIFARYNRNKEYYFRSHSSVVKKRIYSFIPSEGHKNTRYDYLEKIARKKNLIDKMNINRVLGIIWDDLIQNWKDQGIIALNIKGQGIVYQLDYRFWNCELIKDDDLIYICDHCGKIVIDNVQSCCPIYNCTGTLRPIKLKEVTKKNYFQKLYKNLPLSPIKVHEHTAQLEPVYAAKVQHRFINGEINVLSCSTTFEMGVDLGELEIILLKNVPPEPSNYIQRAGRAGRRTNSIGFTITYALLRSHDLSYFNSPLDLILGKIKPPSLNMRNKKIIYRHAFSHVLSEFFRKINDYYGSVNDFFHLSEIDNQLNNINLEENNIDFSFLNTGLIALRDFLETKPKTIGSSLQRIIPKSLHSEMGINNWGWVPELVGPSGILTYAQEDILSEYLELSRFYLRRMSSIQEMLVNHNTNTRKYRKFNSDLIWVDKRKKTLRNTRIINFLASKNVIPKYGFPVDVVELTPLSQIPEAARIRLERDLRIAISEFAPGSQVVANGYIWKSYALRKLRNKEWESYWYAKCPVCQTFTLIKQTAERPKSIECKGCNNVIPSKAIKKFIVPRFGFYTGKGEEPIKVHDIPPKKEYGSRPYFSSFRDPKEYKYYYNNTVFTCNYSSYGELVVICDGAKHGGFFVCNTCGAAFAKKPKNIEHKSPFDYECSGSLLGPIHLGHIYTTDVLTISIEQNNNNYSDNAKFWYSLLYGIIEGACQELQIQRSDLDGCLYWKDNSPSIVIFDNVPGGAGHVSQFIKKDNFNKILIRTFMKLNSCECGLETSCNNCLRNYNNQFVHHLLSRGIVIDFLKAIL